MIGDEFMAKSFGQYSQDIYNVSWKKGYMQTHYDVSGYCNGKLKLNDNFLGRIYNAMVQGMKEQILLPRAVLFVFDDDILDAIDHYEMGLSNAIGRVMEWLANHLHHLISGYKDKLPSKARKFKYPHLLWCLIPKHSFYGHYNDYKDKYNGVVKKICGLFREMDFLTLEQWNPTELDYFSEGHINGNGLASYWNAVDSAFEVWDQAQMNAANAINESGGSDDNRYTTRNYSQNRKSTSHGSNRHHLSSSTNIPIHHHKRNPQFGSAHPSNN